MALVREALLNSLARQKRIKNSDYSSTGDEGDGTDSTGGGAVFVLSDFMEGLKIIEPSLKRGLEMEVQSLGLQPGANIEVEIQGEVGGLSAVRRALDKCIRWPLEHGDKLARLGAVQPNGILLYGPPGCSKTTLVREYAQRFGTLYMISGADIFSCYVGESERTIRSTFLKARLTKPSIIFVDELECIVSKRGSDTSQQDVVRDRILTTFLNELDGVSSTLKSKTKGASQVMLIGSTNRPDLIDEALLRPGRFDKLIYVGPPTDNERMEIAKKLLQQGGIEGLSDIEYQKIITATSGGCCTMADLHKLCTVIKMNEFKKQLKYSDGPENGKEGASNRMDIRTLDEILVNFQPSLSEQMVSFYEDQLKNLQQEEPTQNTTVGEKVEEKAVEEKKVESKQKSGFFETYFFDLHPPLAKMLFALVGKLAGYDGQFDFAKIGLKYDEFENVPFVAMRLLPAILGSLTVPGSYVALRGLGYGIDTALLGCGLVLFENGLVTQSRLILLDSTLVFFTVFATMSYILFINYRDTNAIASDFWMISTGVNMACALSSKWVGLFLFQMIGVYTIYELWEMVGDAGRSARNIMCQIFKRLVGFLGIPFALYFLFFAIHFKVLNKMDKPDPVLSAGFKSAYGHNVETQRQVFFGSMIRLRHTNSNKGYLHSHSHTWVNEKSSKQQQITLYPFPDGNNLWKIERPLGYNATAEGTNDDETLYPVRNGDKLRLLHVSTEKRLHSHNVPAPVSTGQGKYEVSGYGAHGFEGDSNDNFEVSILSNKVVPNKDDYEDEKNVVQAIHTQFTLIHSNLRCHLFSSRKRLPEYAFNQTETFCMSNCHMKHATWHIEYAHHDHLEKDVADIIGYPPHSTWKLFLDYNRQMLSTNQDLLGDHPFASRPPAWPVLRRGTAYWGGTGAVIYQLGNPVVWWLASLSIASVCFLFFSDLILSKREIYIFSLTKSSFSPSSVALITIGYFSHYLPFYLMDRELFLHHYFPALWFSILAIPIVAELASSSLRVSSTLRHSLYLIIFAAALSAFYTFAPITYALTFTKQQCASMKWLPTWDIDCNHAL
ncbi:Dolichyl-phosphate-mannose-protein mannosyltransferase 1 [Zancudomyces culisetae]|uniref:dolichyl-phosphate-mannose--protein mannosyltransferase n=1 Tax=Zancudomyces culisetae TaxID=1213189 RepID=A0A1R1PSB0_ZANCU|nr:Dolichyl-phosphate-mannose-protein mannosyltransferase 1 [Zancudomyces culisetae]|eukprot:OMH83876.1 Dolichyl-phosphate-mannose-protein mannosyltransferase 1 [Zancudomyces culisetae]